MLRCDFLKLKVKILNRFYEMGQKACDGLLKVASEQVPFGIYAVKKGDYIEMRNDVFKSKTKLREAIRAYKQQGFKVYHNGL